MPITTPEHLITTYQGDKDHFQHVLDHLFIPAIKKAGLEPVPPKSHGSELIHATIIKKIEESDLLLCDISSLNPNVFFELGVRTALNKPVCLVRDDITANIPFDTNMINHHTYLHKLEPWNIENQINELSEHVSKSNSENKNENSLWKYFGLSLRAKPIEKGGLDEKMEYLSLEVNALRKTLSDKIPNLSLSNRRIFEEKLMKIFEFLEEKGFVVSAYYDDQENDYLEITEIFPDPSPLIKKSAKNIAEKIYIKLFFKDDILNQSDTNKDNS